MYSVKVETKSSEGERYPYGGLQVKAELRPRSHDGAVDGEWFTFCITTVMMCVPLSGGVPSSTSERAAEMFRDVKVVWSSRKYITAGENCGGWLRNSTQM